MEFNKQNILNKVDCKKMIIAHCPQFLAKEDIPQEIINAHHAATANNMNYFIQVGDSAK